MLGRLKILWLAVVTGLLVYSCSGSGKDKAACDRYLLCVSDQQPEKLEQALATYGSNGTCFEAGSEALCGDICRNQLRDLALAAHGSRACQECTEDSHCVDPKRPGCNLESGLCAQCSTDAHCAAPSSPDKKESSSEKSNSLNSLFKPSNDNNNDKEADPLLPTTEVDDTKLAYCDVDRGACVGCLTDAHCPNGACDKSTGTCEECADDDDCPDDKPYCADGTITYGTSPYNTDTNSYYVDTGDDQSGSSNNSKRRQCVVCSSDAHCSLAKPHCDRTAQKCVECSSDGDCSGSTNGTYCDLLTDKCVECRDNSDCGYYGDMECVEGKCQEAFNCKTVTECLKEQCSYGCTDPNVYCDLTKCDAAVKWAQCAANNCIVCYQDGFSSYDCDNCIYSKCGNLTCGESC